MTMQATPRPAPPVTAPSAGLGRRSRDLLLGLTGALVLVTAATAGWSLAPEDTTPTSDSADAGFARDLVLAHDDALQVSTAVRDALVDPEVRDLAYDLTTVQQAQVGTLSGWLAEWGLPATDPAQPTMAWTTRVQEQGHHHGGGGAEEGAAHEHAAGAAHAQGAVGAAPAQGAGPAAAGGAEAAPAHAVAGQLVVRSAAAHVHGGHGAAAPDSGTGAPPGEVTPPLPTSGTAPAEEPAPDGGALPLDEAAPVGPDGRMAGLADPADLALLARLTGARGEVLYLRLMVAHHEAGVAMATSAVALAARPAVIALARRVVVSETAELEAMRTMLAQRAAGAA